MAVVRGRYSQWSPRLVGPRILDLDSRHAPPVTWSFTDRMSAHVSLINQMENIERRLIADRDERRRFHGAYLRSTEAVMAAAAAGEFADGTWAESWGLAFAQL